MVVLPLGVRLPSLPNRLLHGTAAGGPPGHPQPGRRDGREVASLCSGGRVRAERQPVSSGTAGTVDHMEQAAPDQAETISGRPAAMDGAAGDPPNVPVTEGSALTIAAA